MPSAHLPDWMRSAEARRFVVFVIVGGLNTLVGYGIFAGLIMVGLPTTAAVVIGTVLGVLFNFFSTSGIVFRNKTNGLLPRFVAVYAVQMALNIVMIKLLERAGVPTLVAGALVVAPLAVFTYLAMRYFVFAPKRARPGAH